MWVKICGLTTQDAVDAAVAAGADAIGFVFAPSVRRVSARQAAEMTRHIGVSVTRVAVMQNPTQEELDTVVEVFAPDVLQTDAEDLRTLRIPASLTVLPVLRNGAALPQALPDRLLFEGAVSGTGELADWTAAAAIARRTQVILAGGLHAQNVAAGIRQVSPYGVDVSSGVESAPGRKDPERIREFIRIVRGAEG